MGSWRIWRAIRHQRLPFEDTDLKILFDQNVPRPLARLLAPHIVERAAELGWEELKNGLLLTAAENAGFNVLLSGDKTIHHEQNMAGRRIALV